MQICIGTRIARALAVVAVVAAATAFGIWLATILSAGQVICWLETVLLVCERAGVSGRVAVIRRNLPSSS